MARQYEDTRENKRENRKIGEGSRSSPVGVPGPMSGDSWPSVLIPTPDDLMEEAEQRRSSRREQATEESRENINIELAESLGVDLDDLEVSITDLFESDLDGMEDQTQLLSVVAEGIRNIAATNDILAEQQIAQLTLLNDIATAVEPSSGVTVSGTNQIDDAGVAEPVIPRSNDSVIPTRNLWVRASPYNSEDIYLGDDDVNPNDGMILRPGESFNIGIDFRDDLVWMASDESGAEVQLFGVV